MNTVSITVAICLLLFFLMIYLVRWASRKKKKVIPQRNNRRSAFRLSLWEHECTIRSSSSSEPVFTGLIRDISITGMKIISHDDLTGIDTIKVDFELTDHFSITGKIERRKKLDTYLFEYGMNFTSLDDRTEQRLFKILWDLSREKVVL